MEAHLGMGHPQAERSAFCMKEIIENIVYLLGIAVTGILVHHEVYSFATVIGLAMVLDALTGLNTGGERDE